MSPQEMHMILKDKLFILVVFIIKNEFFEGTYAFTELLCG